jgi:hypothetical protein
MVHLIDPATLQTIGQIQISLAPGSAGLNGISAGVGGSTLYVEGPLPSDPRGCCVLYTIDLTTLQTKVAAGIPGSGTRNSLVSSEGMDIGPAVWQDRKERALARGRHCHPRRKKGAREGCPHEQKLRSVALAL